MSSTNSNLNLLTVDEVSTILRVDPTTVRRWITAGTMKAVILPHPNDRASYRITRETLEELITPKNLKATN